MKLRIKNVGTMLGLLAVIAVAAFLNIGCAENSQNSDSSTLETQASDVSVSETKPFYIETVSTESALDRDTSTEDVSVGDVHLFEREEKISTMFYDLQLDKVTVTDSVGSVAAESGREFMVLDVTITACSDEEIISMYAQEFLLICFLGDSVKVDSEEDYEKLYPLEEGLEEGQLGDVWLAVKGEDIKGKMIYNIPKDAIRTVLLVYDSYTTGELNETVYGDGYMITIPEENWDREE
ncbi:MAG: hypothetical protein HDR25_03910 [Lachnospiraceae bacterium]|nr:hypothetical protein [Lachnospiraceae bacterium]